jgi:hypothetical protein
MSTMKARLLCAAAAAALATLAALPGVARAHYVWATVENGQVRFALLESTSGAPSPQFAKYVTALSSARAGTKALPLGEVKDGARFAALPAGQDVVTAESVVGPRERDGASYLLVYDVKGAASLTAAGTLLQAPAEVLARKEGGELVLSVRQEGWPVPQGEVWVEWPGADAPVSAATDIKGEARIPWPASVRAGFVGVRALVKDPTAGDAEGKKYAAVHRWATLTFPVQASQEDKPLSRVLREAFGKNHEIVADSAFNQAVFEGRLTRPQLEIHLQQRALVHQEVDRILSAAPAALHVPYGPAQKNVLALMSQDLTALGSGLPTEAQARPLTRAFLQEIRDSEAKGPFFALGVHHVYYGGITNGGRMIGAKIGEVVGLTPAYYEKSDGYPEYVAEVNKITDPAARAEMVRGGLAAYRYIIASSNEDVFKSQPALAPKPLVAAP